MRRSANNLKWARVVACAVATTLLPISSRAILLYATGDATSHTAAPTGSFSDSGWQYEGNFGGFTGTAISPYAFITAAHIAPSIGTVFTYGSGAGAGTYTVTSGKLLSNRDLVIRTVDHPFAAWAPIYNEANDGDLLGKTVMLIGRGTQRGAAINVGTSTVGGGTLRGWQWGSYDGVRRWGTNVINDFAVDSTHASDKEYFSYNFDSNGLPDEATVSSGDSGGGNFVRSDSGVWKLAGVNSAVDADYRVDPAVDPGAGAIFDFRDLYVHEDPNDSTSPFVTAQSLYGDETELPAAGYSSNVSDLSASDLAPYVPHNGDADVNGVVDLSDFTVLMSHFNQSGLTWRQGDFNADGTVNALDFNLLASNFGDAYTLYGASPASPLSSLVPEPAIIFAVAMLPLLVRRGRAAQN